MSYDCFISYASADNKLAEELHRRLIAEGFTVWFDKVRLQPGFNWHREIEQGCENSRVLLPVLTPRWKASDWTKFETYGAEAVIPLIFEGAWDHVATPPLEQFQAERFDLASMESEEWGRLFMYIRRILAQPPPLKSVRVIHFHHLPNDYFMGREKELLRIHEELHCNPHTTATHGRVRVIAAMGGAGKTTLARHYAEKFWRCYPQMFWVDCRLGLEPEFAQIHDLLFPESIDLHYRDSDKAVRAFQELQNNATRLLILDNADDEQSITKWIPKTGGCHTLITSQFAAWSAAVKTIHLYLLDRGPALQFLQNRVGREATGSELAACEAVAESLGYLPLAMEQAAAYIAEQGEGFGFADYSRLYQRASADLLAIGTPGGTDYPFPVMTTWLSAMAKLTPGARVILSLGAFLAPTPFPVELLVAAAGKVQAIASTMAGSPGETRSDPEMFIRSALNDIKRYSVASCDGRMFSMHALVQLVVRESLPVQDRALWWGRAVSLLIPHACGHGFRTQLQDSWKPILPHALALYTAWTHLKDVALSTELAEILRDCAYSQGNYEEALPFAQLVYREDLAEFGEASSRAELSLCWLGMVHEKRKDYAAAAEASRCARDWSVRRLGQNNPATLTHTQNLAHALEKLGQAKEAAVLYQSVLAANPKDVVALGNYAYMLQNVLDDYPRARTLYERALALIPGDIINLNNYAGLCLVLEDFFTAEKSSRAAWQIASRRKDRYAARTLFFRLALALMRSEDSRLLLGQLKTVLESGISPAPSENVAVMRYLSEKLSGNDYAFMAAVYDAMNDRSALDRLWAFPQWIAAPSVELENPWPESL